MNSDLITKLRSSEGIGFHKEAADEIERLRAALAKIAYSTADSIFQDVAKNALSIRAGEWII